MKIKTLLAQLICISTAIVATAKTQPNILWILTDDHRYDSIQAFNKMLTGKKTSPLGNVLSPNIDKLAKQGTTFINAYSQVQSCAPSRASLHYGRYPWHTGVYGFEYHNNKAKHMEKAFPELLADLGYQTMHIGKTDLRRQTLNQNSKPQGHSAYQTYLNFNKMASEGLGEWGKIYTKQAYGVKFDEVKSIAALFTKEGETLMYSPEFNKISGLEKINEDIDKKYDILRNYSGKEKKEYGVGEIIGGVCPQDEDKTRDAWYNTELKLYLENPNLDQKMGSQKFKGVDPSKPVFIHLAYNFPHTPVLPPQRFRDIFKNEKYKVPQKDSAEFDKLPPQLRKLITNWGSDHYSDKEKQQMIKDYYAFCAYGDFLVGNAVKTFVDYCNNNKQEWVIIYINGDHGWKLNEHGAISKFSPWEIDARDPIVILSSDKTKFKSNKVEKSFAEFVDIAPTVLALAGANLKDEKYKHLDGYDLAKVANKTIPQRDYIIGENSHVIGHRASIRTKDYMFSARSRPAKLKKGQDLQWAINAPYEDIEPALYDLNNDPQELNNLAFNKEYQDVAQKMKKKLFDIVLGDNRIEGDWGKDAQSTTFYKSNFAVGSDDKKLKIDKK